MINVVYEREAHRLTVKGHAESGAYGHDLVCCAVSMLTFTLARAVEELEDKGFLKSFTVRLDKGDAEITCDGEYHRCYKLTFDSLCLGYEMLAEEYPKNISYMRA